MVKSFSLWKILFCHTEKTSSYFKNVEVKSIGGVNEVQSARCDCDGELVVKDLAVQLSLEQLRFPGLPETIWQLSKQIQKMYEKKIRNQSIISEATCLHVLESHFVIVCISEARYPALSSPQAILWVWREVEGNRDILHPFFLPRVWVGSVLHSQRLPVDRGGVLFLLEGLKVVLWQASINALFQL